MEVRFHELRHAYASLALQGGDDIKTVQENMGHATPEFTMKVYAYVNQTMKKNAAARMENTIKSLMP
ncbi:MAG: tyrosine-type recombinase/integrase [Oscillospiraceae bacterium]|nr:tyrosine-type recombinase/integrase [Oscillospiraceae bacterium]